VRVIDDAVLCTPRNCIFFLFFLGGGVDTQKDRRKSISHYERERGKKMLLFSHIFRVS